MNATELFTKEGQSASIFYCQQCRRVGRTKFEAEACCEPSRCTQCGCPELRKYHTICDECNGRKAREREAALFEKAEKVTDWDGWFYIEGMGYNEGYFENLEDLEEWLEMEEIEDRPKYAWTCDAKRICYLDYGSIIEQFTDDAYEYWEPEMLSGKEELEKALDAFNELNKDQVSYYPGYKKAFLIPTK